MENADLGQVFTKRAVADYMVDLFTLSQPCRILDPCFGQGVFIKSLFEKTCHTIVGVELDERLYSRLKQECTGELARRCTVLSGDFLKLTDADGFDGIIMNPPYIRQEKIDELNTYGINKVDIRKDDLYSGLPSNANMYMYFIVKGISLLKAGGEMIVIFPGTWQRSASGGGFLQMLRKQCSIVRTITVRGAAFETDALVDVVILKLVKDKDAVCLPPEVVWIDGGDIVQQANGRVNRVAAASGEHFDGEMRIGAVMDSGFGANSGAGTVGGIDAENGNSAAIGGGAYFVDCMRDEACTDSNIFAAAPGMVSFSEAASIRRGLTTGNNAMFVNPQNHGYDGPTSALTPLISSPKSIHGYTTEGYKKDYLLLVDEKQSHIPEIAAYLDHWHKKIIREQKPKTLYERIHSGDTHWYRQSQIRADGLLFGYIVRNDMKFIDVRCEAVVRDNFYIIKPLIDKNLLFALLNNYYTYYQLECRGKHYGAGVLKLQKYDLESLYLIDPLRIRENDKVMLMDYVNLLRSTGDAGYVESITQVLGSYGPVDGSTIREMCENAKRKRLEVNV